MFSAVVRKAGTLLAALLLPSPLAVACLRLLGHRVGPACRVGVSVVLVDRLLLAGNNRIGHFNLLHCRRVVMRKHAYIGRFNVANGPFSISLGVSGAIGNNNKIVRGPAGIVTHGPALLKLGELAKITSEHRVDCTCSVHIGDYSTLAGVGSQIWTHAYIHDLTGPGRYRIDGKVRIANNVYIGAGSIVSMAVSICPGAMIGAGTTVSRSLTEPGLYVSSPMRQLPRPAAPHARTDLTQIVSAQLCEPVFLKKPAS